MTAKNAPRKNVVKMLAPGTVTGLKPRRGGSFNGEFHHHGCAVCSHRYSDACDDSGGDGICKDCLPQQLGRPSWERDSDPEPCCHGLSRPVTQREIQSYRLAGTAQWWICATCCRTHPYNPLTPGPPRTRSAR